MSSFVPKRIFRFFNPRFFLVLGILLFFGFGKGKAAFPIDTSYDGKYRWLPAFDKILADLPYVYQEAMQKINNSLGIPVPERINVVVIFSDHLTHNGMRLRGKRRSVEGSQGKIIHYIYLDLEFLINGQATLIEEMTHELTHSVMAEALGLEKYDDLPMWVKEGTAVHAADQGLARIKALTKRGFNLAELGDEDEGDDGNPISLEKYVENYLKVQFLIKTFGISAFQKFLNSLLKSGDFRKELAAGFEGLNEETMNLYARDFIARTLISNSRPIEAREQMAKGLRFFDEGEFLSARLAFTEALNAGLSGEEYQKAAYLLAECFIQERHPEAAFTILRRIKPNPSSIPLDRYAFLQAYTQYALGFVTEAYLGFKKAFETSNNPAVQEGALYYAFRILLELNNREEASNVLAFMRRRFPGSSYLSLASDALQRTKRY